MNNSIKTHLGKKVSRKRMVSLFWFYHFVGANIFIFHSWQPLKNVYCTDNQLRFHLVTIFGSQFNKFTRVNLWKPRLYFLKWFLARLNSKWPPKLWVNPSSKLGKNVHLKICLKTFIFCTYFVSILVPISIYHIQSPWKYASIVSSNLYFIELTHFWKRTNSIYILNVHILTSIQRAFPLNVILFIISFNSKLDTSSQYTVDACE